MLGGRGANSTRKDRLQMPSGKISWFNTAKNFGFIEPDDGSPDVFCHGTALDGIHYDVPIVEGLKVSFERIPSPKKSGAFCADAVKLAK